MGILKEGIQLHKRNFISIGQQLIRLPESIESHRRIIKPGKEKRRLSQNVLSHVLKEQLSEYLIRRGKAIATKELVKNTIGHTCACYEQGEIVGVISGEKIIINSLRPPGIVTGDMHFLTHVEGRPLNIGCKLTVPGDSENQKLEGKQNR